jgi:hypothetical protein
VSSVAENNKYKDNIIKIEANILTTTLKILKILLSVCFSIKILKFRFGKNLNKTIPIRVNTKFNAKISYKFDKGSVSFNISRKTLKMLPEE